MYLKFQQMQPKERIPHHNIPLWPWEVVWADVFHFNNKNYLCIIDYNSKFPTWHGNQSKQAEAVRAKTVTLGICANAYSYGSK